MPDFVREALIERGLIQAYIDRPPYQRNDYIGRILRARQTKTRQKRITQMFDELESGDSYLKMKYQDKSSGGNKSAGSGKK